jgi:hypothetical protein
MLLFHIFHFLQMCGVAGNAANEKNVVVSELTVMVSKLTVVVSETSPGPPPTACRHSFSGGAREGRYA